MHLYLEIYERSNSNLEKKFNELGQLISEEYADTGYGGYSKKIFYDDLQRIEKELETKWTTYDNGNEQKFLKIYEYDGNDYKIFSYLTHFRDNSQNLYEQFFEEKKYVKVDDLLCFENYRYLNNLLIYKKIVSIENKSAYSIEYTYEDERVKSEKRYDDDKLSYNINFFYLEKKLFKEIKTMGSYSEQIEYTYNLEELTNVSTFKCFLDKKILKREETFITDDNSKIEIKEIYEIINERRYIVCKEKNYKSEHRIIKEFRDLNGYLLNYGLDEDALLSVSGSSFGNEENSSAVEEIYDCNNNLIEQTFFNPENHEEILSKYFFHNEYNQNGKLEISIVFNLDIKYLKLYTDSTTKFYYR